MVLAFLIGRVIGAILGMDLIDVKIQPDRVTYVYRNVGLTRSRAILELKAKLMSLLDPPADIPIDIRIYPEKGGILNSYIVEVDVPARHFKTW